MSWARLRAKAKDGDLSPHYRENEAPSAIAYTAASSDSELGDDTTGGLSKVESFSDDPTVEIMRLKALLSKREDELAEKTSLLTQREALLRQSKEIIDRLIRENDSLKQAADKPRVPTGSANASAAASPSQSPRTRAVPATTTLGETAEQPSGRSATVKSLVSQQEATLNHVVDRVEAFRRAEQELLKEKSALAEQVQSLSEQVGADEAKILEAQQQTKAAQSELATKAAEYTALQAEWEETQRALTEKHGTVLQKYAHKKQALHAANEDAAKHAARADALGAKLAGLERTVKVLEGQKEEDAQKYKELVVDLEQRQRTLDAHAARGLSRDKEWQSRHDTQRQEAGQKEAMLLRKQADMEKALDAKQQEHQRLSTALSQAEAEVIRLRAECKKQSEAAEGASNDTQLQELQRLARENTAYNASMVQKTVEVLGSIIERTGSTTSPLAVLPEHPDEAYRTGARPRSPSAIESRRQTARNRGISRRRRSGGALQIGGGEEDDFGYVDPAARHDMLNAVQLTHADILNRVCAQLDLSHPKELIPFSIRVSNLLAFGNKLQSFVHEVRALAGGESDEAALQKLRELPALENQRRQLVEFERRVRGLVSRRPNFRHMSERSSDGWFMDAQFTAGGSIDGMKSTLYNLTEMLHFEISSVELRSVMHKADAQLALQPEDVIQATMGKVEQLLGVASIDAVIPSMQEWRVSQIEAEASRNKLAEMLQLSTSCTWAEVEESFSALISGSTAR